MRKIAGVFKEFFVVCFALLVFFPLALLLALTDGFVAWEEED